MYFRYTDMGLEQLAALKQQLTQQAKRAGQHQATKKQARQPDGPAQNEGAPKATPRVDRVVHTIGRLQKNFPKAFPKNPAPKVPLKVGILNDLLAQKADLSISGRELKDAIKVWCRGNRYWSSLVEGAARVDLTGDPTGQVSSADAGRARQLQGGRSIRSASAVRPDEPVSQAGTK